MAMEPGTRLGPYEVLASIGDSEEQRYKASDTRRHQLVAVKLLPADFAADPSRRARLEETSQAISALRHPQICPVVEVGHQEPSTHFVVSELVEGETLGERLARGALELAEALPLAIAIADTLDKAHRKGLVHGGLNPSVVVLAAAGPRLLEFGVAGAAEGVGGVPGLSMASTRLTSLAELSAVPTAAALYLAPEQLAGAAADARTDLFAFGALLYHMVTGRPPFQEKTQALLVAAIQTVDPERASQLQRAIPPALDFVIQRCLTKDPRQRFQTALDVLMELRWITSSSVKVLAPVSGTVRRRSEWAIWVASAVIAAVALSLVPSTLARLQKVATPDEARFVAYSIPAATTPVALSPDGRWLSAASNAGAAIGLSLDSVTPQTLIPGVPLQPFWSPDSRSMAYIDGTTGKLMRAAIGGGPAQIITDVQPPFSAGTWNAEGVILFPSARLIQRVLAAGGQPAPVTSLDTSRQEVEHVAPVFLPDGRHFLFLAVSSKPENTGIYVGTLGSTERTRLIAAESKALYAAPGYILFNRGDTVFAQAFDAGALTLKGEPVRVASGVPMLAVANQVSSAHSRWAAFAVSQTGVLAFRVGASTTAANEGTEESRSLFWFDRTGQRRTLAVGTVGGYTGIDLSPDGRRVAVHRHQGGGGDSWLVDLSEGRMQRFTFDAAQENASPIWSPDGSRVAFASERNGQYGLYVKPADGTGAEELVFSSPVPKVPMGWSPDGKLLLYEEDSSSGDIWMVPVAGDKKPVPLLQSQFGESFPQVSPDGKWMAYMSNETGRNEIYVRAFPNGAAKWQISSDGGTVPRWRRDGKELFFYFNNILFAAPIRMDGSSLEPGVPRMLFGLAPLGSASPHRFYYRYAVSADGQRFLVSQPGDATGINTGGLAGTLMQVADRNGGSTGATPNAVTVVLNWTRMLDKN